MFRPLTALSLTLLLASAQIATAQDADTAAPETPDAPSDSAQPDASTLDSVLDMGQPVISGPALGQRYVKESFGDWALACVKTQDPVDPCSLVQTLLGQNGNAVAEISLFRLEEGGQVAAAATVIVPLETLLPGQLTIAVDNGIAKRYEYQFCNQVGCIARIGLTDQDVSEYKKGGAATVSIVPALAPDQVISLQMSLIGFTAGYDAVDIVQN